MPQTPSSAFLLIAVSQSLLPWKTSRKSARFRAGRCCSPYPLDYRTAFACSAFLYPLSHQSSLRSTCRCRRLVGLTVFRTHHSEWGRSCLYTGGLHIRVRRTKGRRSRPRTVLVQACQHLWLVMPNGACSSSLLLTMPLSLASHPPRCWQVTPSPRGSRRGPKA